MKEDAPARSRARSRLRGALVVAQVAVSLMLLVAAGLVFRGLEKARDIDSGFDRARRRSAAVDLQPGGYTEAAEPVFLTGSCGMFAQRRVDRIGEPRPLRAARHRRYRNGARRRRRLRAPRRRRPSVHVQ